MKKLALIVLVTLSSLSLYAQKNGVGIKAGLSSTQVDFEGEQLVPSDAQLGYHVGGICTVWRGWVFCTAGGVVYANYGKI